MSDWMQQTAAAIRRIIPSGVITEAEIMDQILRHAPPQPGWVQQPTRAGWWNFITEETPGVLQAIDMKTPDIGCAWVARLSNRWYGPIPSSPATPTEPNDGE